MSYKMVLKILFVIASLVSYVVSDSCVTYDFEGEFDNSFSSYGVCESMPMWYVGDYSTVGLTSPSGLSTKFVSPHSSMSCASSFLFTMNAGGIVEVNLYMEPTSANDHLQILVQQELSGGVAFITGMKFLNTVNGWITAQITLAGPEVYQGYISIIGMASPNSIVLVDSFRYIPPGTAETVCWIYEPPPTTPAPNPDCIRPPGEDNSWFWTKLIIALIILLNLVVLVLTCIVFYELGRSKASIPLLKRFVSTAPPPTPPPST
ncbi:uncharacterized protein LOC111355145 [Spodoptera litura]|uniref:Uncharacterized protein LOC111355145 n=1 Tax=Spodoptera litura TaxID=69820 RepID=A0A9J7E562_SPOLT|nr:uncharacterized protein LOC111355145 [Spodoptera litura]